MSTWPCVLIGTDPVSWGEWTMTQGELRAKAKELYEQAERIKDADGRLAHVLRALQFEMQADALERDGDSTPRPHVLDQQAGGGDREDA